MRFNTINICADGLLEAFTRQHQPAPLKASEINLTPAEADDILGRWVDGFAQSGSIDALLLNVNYHVSLIPSQVFDTAWEKTDGTRLTVSQLESIPHWNSYFIRLHELGIEPFGMVIRHARRAGLQVWFSVRMNEYHYLRWPETSATLWLHHPEYRIAEEKPFDYRHRAVRDYYQAYITELCEKWDIDGIELDLIRRFEPGATEADRAIMTGFVREIRSSINAISMQKAASIALSARVYALPEAAMDCWCDPVLWIREGYIDGLTLSNFFTPCNHDIPIERWRELIGKSEGFFLQAGCDLGNFCLPRSDPRRRLVRQNTQTLKGFADCAWAHGADGIYAFNLNTPDRLDFTCLNSPDASRSGWRSHILTRHDPGGDEQFPLTLNSSWQKRIVFAGSGGRRCVVRVGIDIEAHHLEVRLCGHPCRALGRLLPRPGEEYEPQIGANDHGRIAVNALTAAAPYIFEFEAPTALSGGYADVELRGVGDVVWLELHIEN